MKTLPRCNYFWTTGKHMCGREKDGEDHKGKQRSAVVPDYFPVPMSPAVLEFLILDSTGLFCNPYTKIPFIWLEWVSLQCKKPRTQLKEYCVLQ